jgi:hypothetical protein
LDSFNALSVVRTLADLAHSHQKTIIFTIHQPRSDVYTLFDELLVLRKGQALYCGPGNEASAYFKALGKPCPDGYNMADHLLDLASMEDFNFPSHSNLNSSKSHPTLSQKSDPELGQVPSTPLTNSQSTHRRESSTSSTDQNILVVAKLSGEQSRSNGTVKNGSIAGSEGGDASVPVAVGFLTQTTALMERALKNLIRTPSLLLAHVILSIILGGMCNNISKMWSMNTNIFSFNSFHWRGLLQNRQFARRHSKPSRFSVNAAGVTWILGLICHWFLCY